MKKIAIFTLILSTILLALFVNIRTNSVVKIEVSYIEDTTQNELLNLTADVPKDFLEYKEENNILRTFAGRKTFNYEDVTFDYLNSWVEVNMEEIKDPTFLINGRNAVFNVIKEQSPEKFTLDDYITSTKQVLEKEDNIEILYNEKTTINNIEGFNLVYTIKQDDNINHLNQFCVIKNNTIYVFSYYADQDNYDKYLKDFQELLLTLTIAEKG